MSEKHNDKITRGKIAEEITEDKWINLSVDFDHESVALEVHATGWYYEHSFVTYKVTKK